MKKSKIQLVPLDAIIRINPDLMRIMNIPEVPLIDDHEELWTFIKLDKHKKFNNERRYLISNYARVYDIPRKVMLNDHTAWKSKVDYYRQVTLRYDDGIHFNYLKHRLVALAFIPKTIEDEKKGREFVNHIDGNPSHNWVWNLEWVTASENMQHAADTGLWILPKGEKRSTAKWTDAEVHIICKMMEDGHKATYIYQALGDMLKDPEKVQYERVRTLYKHIKKKTHWKHIACQYNIDYTKYNYAKEQASVKQVEEKREAAKEEKTDSTTPG